MAGIHPEGFLNRLELEQMNQILIGKKRARGYVFKSVLPHCGGLVKGGQEDYKARNKVKFRSPYSILAKCSIWFFNLAILTTWAI